MPSHSNTDSTKTVNADKLPPKKKTKTFIPITAEQTRIGFLEKELCAAQSRIVQLDASLKDKDQRVSVLMARIKIFEDENTRTVHEKYFPASNTTSQPPRCPSANSAPPSIDPQNVVVLLLLCVMLKDTRGSPPNYAEIVHTNIHS